MPSGQLQTQLEHHPAASGDNTPKKQTGQTPEPCRSESCSIGSAPAQQLLRCSHQPVLTTNQPEGQFLPLMCKQQPRLNYNRRAHTTHTRGTLELQALVTIKTVPLGPTAHLLHKAALLRLGGIVALANTQTQGGSQSGETKKHVPNKRTEQSSRKGAKQNDVAMLYGCWTGVYTNTSVLIFSVFLLN